MWPLNGFAWCSVNCGLFREEFDSKRNSRVLAASNVDAENRRFDPNRLFGLPDSLLLEVEQFEECFWTWWLCEVRKVLLLFTEPDSRLEIEILDRRRVAEKLGPGCVMDPDEFIFLDVDDEEVLAPGNVNTGAEDEGKRLEGVAIEFCQIKLV